MSGKPERKPISPELQACLDAAKRMAREEFEGGLETGGLPVVSMAAEIERTARIRADADLRAAQRQLTRIVAQAQSRTRCPSGKPQREQERERQEVQQVQVKEQPEVTKVGAKWMTPAQRERVREMYQDGVTIAAICEEMGFCKSSVHRALKGLARRHGSNGYVQQEASPSPVSGQDAARAEEVPAAEELVPQAPANACQGHSERKPPQHLTAWEAAANELGNVSLRTFFLEWSEDRQDAVAGIFRILKMEDAQR